VGAAASEAGKSIVQARAHNVAVRIEVPTIEWPDSTRQTTHSPIAKIIVEILGFSCPTAT